MTSRVPAHPPAAHWRIGAFSRTLGGGRGRPPGVETVAQFSIKSGPVDLVRAFVVQYSSLSLVARPARHSCSSFTRHSLFKHSILNAFHDSTLVSVHRQPNSLDRRLDFISLHPSLCTRGIPSNWLRLDAALNMSALARSLGDYQVKAFHLISRLFVLGERQCPAISRPPGYALSRSRLSGHVIAKWPPGAVNCRANEEAAC